MVQAGTVSKGGPRVVESWTRKRFTEASAAGTPCRRALPPAALPEYVQLTHSIADARMACRNHPCAGLGLGLGNHSAAYLLDPGVHRRADSVRIVFRSPVGPGHRDHLGQVIVGRRPSPGSAYGRAISASSAADNLRSTACCTLLTK